MWKVRSNLFVMLKCHRFIDAFQAKMRFPPEEQRDQFRTFVQKFETAMWAHPLWRNASAEEADAASEALERLLTMRLYAKYCLRSLQDAGGGGGRLKC